MEAVARRVNEALEDVRAIVKDWEPMRDKALALADDLGQRTLPVSDESRQEAQEFLRWAADNHFTFFGYREYKVEKQGREDVLAAHSESCGPAEALVGLDDVTGFNGAAISVDRPQRHDRDSSRGVGVRNARGNDTRTWTFAVRESMCCSAFRARKRAQE